jgi:hypothetical protein
MARNNQIRRDRRNDWRCNWTITILIRT